MIKKRYDLVGINGNAFSIMGYVSNAMRESGKSNKEISDYRKRAMSSDYDNLKIVSIEMIDNLNTENGFNDDFPPYDDYEEDMNEALMNKIIKNVNKILNESLKNLK